METQALSTASTATHVLQKAPRGRPIARRLGLHALAPYAFVLPFLFVFLAFFIAPFIYAFYQSLFEMRSSGLGLGPAQTVWVGIANYIKALHDPNFLDGFGRVLLFGAVQIPVMMTVAITLALLMDSAIIRLRRFFRLAFFIPYAVPGVVAAIMWGFFYSPDSSPIVHLLQTFSVTPPSFYAPGTTLWSIANISTWEYTGYNMVIFYSALQGIPQELYESGRIDGLSETGIALRLKLPLILPAVIFGILFSLIGTLQLFNEPLILKNYASAITTHYTPNYYAYTQAVVNTNFNYGGTLAVILGVITFAFSFGFLRLTRRQSGV
jgi:multiple sugar transport system permease protein